LTGTITFTKGVIAKFRYYNSKFVLLALYQESSVGAVELPVDEATPSVANGYLFVTNAGCASGSEDITDFLDAVVGVPFKVIGGGGTYPQVITKALKFAYITATWTGTAGASITLEKRPSGDFVQIG